MRQIRMASAPCPIFKAERGFADSALQIDQAGNCSNTLRMSVSIWLATMLGPILRLFG